MTDNRLFIVGDTRVVFMMDKKNRPQPIGVDCKVDENGIIQDMKWIQNYPIFMEAIEYVNYVRRQRNKKTGKYETVPLFPYQMACFLMIIHDLVYKKSAKSLMAWARQLAMAVYKLI